MDCRFPKDLYDLGEYSGSRIDRPAPRTPARIWSVWSADSLRICMTWANILAPESIGPIGGLPLGSGQYGVQIP